MVSDENRRRIDYGPLASKMKGGSESAMTEFIVEFGELLRRYFLSHGVPSVHAEDMAVDCAEDIVLKLDRFQDQGVGSFNRWCFAIARHKLVDWRRAHCTTTVAISEDPAVSMGGVPSEHSSDLAKAVQEALATLPEDDREILLLRFCHQEPAFSVIARWLDIPETVARVRCHRAIRRLYELLTPMAAVAAWRKDMAAKEIYHGEEQPFPQQR